MTTQRVYQYGTPASYRPSELVLKQVDLAHALRNKLVEIEHTYLERMAEAWRAHPGVAEAEQAKDAALDALDLVREQVRKARVPNQTTEPSAAAKAAMSTAKKELSKATAAFKEAKAAAKATDPAVEHRLKEAVEQRKVDRKAAWTAARSEGLFGDTATDLLDKAVAAEKLVANAWKKGLRAGRRFKRRDGTGTITAQLRKQPGKSYTPAALADPKSPMRNTFNMKAVPGKPRHGVVNMQVANVTEGSTHMESVPIALHRLLPVDGEVKRVQLTTKRIGTQLRRSVQVTVELPDPEPKQGGLPVSVILGWSSVPNTNGAIQVARISSPVFDICAVEVPYDLRDVVVPGAYSDNSTYIEVVVPANWRYVLEHASSIRSLRDSDLDVVRPEVVKALAADPGLAEQLDVKPSDVERWRAARRFQWLATKWPEGHVLNEDLHRDLFNVLTEGITYRGKTAAQRRAKKKARQQKLAPLSTLALWRLRDRHLEDYGAHETAQILARRKDAWRKLAAWICDMASDIMIDAPPVSDIRRIPDVDQEDTKMARKGRIQAQIAAPGDLAAAFRHAAARRGVPVGDARKD